MKPDQETLGRYLRRERETRHVTVDEIALFIGINRPLVEALEADDFDCFSRRDCLRLVKQYTAYLNLNQTEAVRRFDGQWRKSGPAKRYPKLTHFTDRDESREKRAGFSWRRLFAGYSPARMGWLSIIVGLLIIVPLLFLYLPDRKPELLQSEPSPPSRVEERAVPAAEHPAPQAAGAGIRDVVPRRAPATDPLYSPPGRSAPNPAPPPKGVRVVGNRDTKRYHLPGMKYYDSVKAYHRVIFQSEQEAVRAGYVKARQ